jgi:hypothetical protein
MMFKINLSQTNAAGLTSGNMSLSVVPIWTEPSFGLLFRNSTHGDIALAVKIDYCWCLAPIIRAQMISHIIPIQEGATVEWRAISFRTCSLHNLVQHTNYSLEYLEAFQCDDLIEWQGQTTVSFGMLGHTIQIDLY